MLCKRVHACDSLERVSMPQLCLPAGLSVAIAPPHAWDAALRWRCVFPYVLQALGCPEVINRNS